MAYRLADSIIGGYFNNLKGKSTFGVIALEGLESPVRFELTGDASESLRGRSFEFRRPDTAGPPTPVPAGFAPLQVGAVGTMEVRMVKVPSEDWEEAYKQRRQIDYQWLPLLYLEWYSQNGRVVLELDNPLIKLDEGQPFPDLEYPDEESEAGLSVGIIRPLEEAPFEVREYDPAEYGKELEDDDCIEFLHSEDQSDDDLESFLDELELGERLVASEEGEFLASLLDPQQLPHADDVDEEEAEGLVMSLLAQLALRSVGVHLCPHCTWREAYRYVLEELIFAERVPPEITGSAWTMNYSYGETCPECLAEIDEKHKDFRPEDHLPEDDLEEP